MDEFKNNPDEPENKEEINREFDTPETEIFARINPVAAGFIGIFGGFFLYQILGGGLSFAIFGMSTEDDPVNAVRLLTMAGQILFMLLPALLLSKMVYEDVSAVIKIKKPDIAETALFIGGMIILTPLLQAYIAIQTHYINQWADAYKIVNDLKIFFDDMNELVENAYSHLLSANNVFDGLLIIVIVAVVPAVAEETLFRGFIQRSFQFKMSPFLAALITAFFFGMFHFSPYGMLPLITLGLYFGYAAYKTDSLIIPMLLHFFNNFVAVLICFMIGNQEIIESQMTSTVDLRNSFILFGVLLIMFIALIVFINYYYSNRTRRSYADLS